MSDWVYVSGMSGAGRSTVAAALEDLGWYVIDNLPPSLLNNVAELVARPNSEIDRVALVIGRGGGEDVASVVEVLDSFESAGRHVRVLFLDAPDDVLVRRYEGTRRRHPYGGTGVEASIAGERKLLGPLKDRADYVLDTGELNIHQLRQRINELFAEGSIDDSMQTSVVSFGYKHGIPIDVDLVLDCRFLPNPYWEESLRTHSGLDEDVRRFVTDNDEAQAFLDRVHDLLKSLIPSYRREGKSYLTVALGCTGGRHRSVAMAQALAERLEVDGKTISAFHRDVDR